MSKLVETIKNKTYFGSLTKEQLDDFTRLFLEIEELESRVKIQDNIIKLYEEKFSNNSK